VPDPDTARLAQQRLGTIIRGKYRIDRVLGMGGMGIVYAATHRNQKQFAIKMLHPELSQREDIRARFLREGYASNSVKHPGAVAVMDDDVAEDGSAFLVMELLEGAPVEDLWEKNRRRLPLSYALAITHQMLDVLAAAHAKGIVHRDIKPANVFLTFEGQVKVLDFGIARVRDLAVSNMDSTRSGTLLGTPAFMSPEQALARSKEIDGQTDVWAVGATLFALLSGQMVHEGDTANDLLMKVATTQARSLATVSPEMPAPVVHVVDAALAYEKARRWPGAAAMRDAVRDATLAALGRVVARDSLLPLFAPEDLGLAQTQHAEAIASTPFASRPYSPVPTPPAGGPPLVVIATNPPPRVEGILAPGGTLRASGPALPVARVTPHIEFVGATTSQPVSSTQAPRRVAGPPKSARPVIAAASIVALALIGAGVVAAIKFLPHPPDSATTAVSPPPVTATLPGTATVATVASSVPAPSTTGAPSAPTAEATPVHAPGAMLPEPVATKKKLSSAVPATAAESSPPMSRPAAVAPPAPTPPAATAATAPPSSSSATCDPPYYFDTGGNRIFKKECL